MRRLTTVRASALPAGFVCGGSLHAPDLLVDPESKPAGLGSATHEALTHVVEADSVPWDILPEIARRWRVDETQLRILVALGAKIWPQVRDRFPRALTEQAFRSPIPGAEDVWLTGHIDLLSRTGDTQAEIGDWKTGHKDAEYRHQVLGYASLVFLEEPEIETVRASVLWLRDAEIEEYRVDRAGARAWLADLAKVVAWEEGVDPFRPGTHCVHCKRSHECRAANAIVRRDVASILDVEEHVLDLANMAPSAIVELAAKASMVEKIAKSVREAIKAHVEASGGRVRSPEGTLEIQRVQPKSVDVIRGWPVLEAHGFGDEEFAATVKISLPDVRDLVAKRAGRGKGAGAVRALVADLEAADAITTSEFSKLVTKRGTSDEP